MRTSARITRRMRYVLVSLLALSACATAPIAPPAPVGPAPAETAPAPPSATARLLRAAGGADAPSLAATQQALGAPDILRQDGAGAALTYRLDSCALLLLFAADSDNQMRLVEAHAGPRQAGALAPSLEQCAAEADARTTPQ
jgi:hypothetical protein